ncbi:MAG: hypothetical protein AMXMBFR84_16840 [Candidatus Hydrogenedentota bacterium]
MARHRSIEWTSESREQHECPRNVLGKPNYVHAIMHIHIHGTGRYRQSKIRYRNASCWFTSSISDSNLPRGGFGCRDYDFRNKEHRYWHTELVGFGTMWMAAEPPFQRGPWGGSQSID